VGQGSRRSPSKEGNEEIRWTQGGRINIRPTPLTTDSSFVLSPIPEFLVFNPRTQALLDIDFATLNPSESPLRYAPPVQLKLVHSTA
jgi:hypothetical protein